MHNVRSSSPEGMTAGWAIYGAQLETAIYENIVAKLKKLKQVIEWEQGNYRLGQIPTGTV